MEPYLSEIFLVSFNFTPRGFAQCNGQVLPISVNQSLYALLGTRFGGNGMTDFALPDLRGRCLIHAGNGFSLGEQGGSLEHILTLDELPTHNHPKNFSSSSFPLAAGLGTSLDPANRILAAHPDFESRFSPRSDERSADFSETFKTENTGGGQAHPNMMPFLTLNYIIAIQGLFPFSS